MPIKTNVEISLASVGHVKSFSEIVVDSTSARKTQVDISLATPDLVKSSPQIDLS